MFEVHQGNLYGVEVETGSMDDHVRRIMTVGSKEICEAFVTHLNKLIKEYGSDKESVDKREALDDATTNRTWHRNMSKNERNKHYSKRRRTSYRQYRRKEKLADLLAQILKVDYVYISGAITFKCVPITEVLLLDN